MAGQGREQIYARALETVAVGDVRTGAVPAIFTSCRRKAAEDFTATCEGYTLIHHTQAGAALEKADLFACMPHKLAYLHWFYLSARFVAENSFPAEVMFFGDTANPSSTAFGLEIPMIFHAKPHVRALFNPLDGTRTPRERWLETNHMRPYIIALANTWMCGPQPQASEAESVLFKKFGEAVDGLPVTSDALDYRTEMGLKVMLAAYMGRYGKFPADGRIASPYGMALKQAG